ncbi:hypothetical protein B0H13DRAFT_2031913 [Mycena leptocephala]|nr:hypothetical protein B0H13DRAFT_2031913 [Mycena leptocephala]
MTVPSTIDNTYGLLYIAVVFWMYIRKYHTTDPWVVKGLVIAVIICDTCQQALLCHAVSDANQIGLTTLTRTPSTLMIELFFSCAIATLVQQFYCWRIYKIGKSVILAGAVSLVSWSSCVYSVKAVKLQLLSEKLSVAANSLSAVTDVTISIVLVILLHSAKTGFKRSTDLINRLFLRSVATICVPILMLFAVGRFYTNSILVTLNSREYIKSGSESASREHYSLEHSSARVRQAGSQQRDAITIRIDTDTILGSSQDMKSAQ